MIGWGADREEATAMTDREAEFSVYVFFANGNSMPVRTFIPAGEAVKVAQRYATNPAARLGITKRIIITDGGDDTVFEWKRGKGVTFPPPEELTS
jgi:hypothetical protein